jgi:hypothetical protein
MSNRKTMTRLAQWFVLFTVVSFAAAAAHADDFRVENRVYAGGSKMPQTHGTTIFSGGLVYDFLDEPAEVVVLDVAAGKFSLLDVHRKVRTVLPTADVETFVGRIKRRAAEHKDPLLHFLANPSFDEAFDPKSDALTLKSEWVTYRAELRPTEPIIAKQYRGFSDWEVRLNTVLSASAPPPFARLVLNEAIARHDAVAKSVRRTQSSKSGSPPTTIRSEHELSPRLSATDRERVARAGEWLRTFPAVAFDQYRKGLR